MAVPKDAGGRMETRIQNDDLMAVVQEAMKRSPEEREGYLRSACGGDQAFYDEVVEALNWEERMGNFLEVPLVDCAFLVRPFEPVQVVAERFEILRELGEGGMGMVYEAYDRRLQQRVAIKAAKPGFQRLLSPELKSALKVTHHNICRVNEIHTVHTEWGEVDFLTMEFLEGKALSVHLKEAGKLRHDEALEVACQVCAGLAEAHQSGIIHRDLKSGNVMLCRNEDGSRRAVITDFGLAGPSASSGEVAGTPAYMAPELWRGEPASKLTDIYALGVVLYEMVAGSRPYQREEDAKLGRQKTVPSAEESVPKPENKRRCLISVTEAEWGQTQQTRASLPPSAWTKGLDPRWDRVIMGCLELDSAERTQDVGEVVAELRRKRIPKWPFATAGIVVLVLAAAIGMVPSLRQWVTDIIWPPNVRLAVLPYEGPKELAAVGSGALQEAAERIQQLPSSRRTVAVISPSRLAQAHADTPERARDVLHATHALKVAIHPDGGEVSVQASVIDLKSQRAVRELSARYTQSDIGALPGALTGLAAGAFKLSEPSSEDKLSPAATEPYLKGIYLLNHDEHRFDEAIAQFQKATQLDPMSALPPAGMALALVQKYNSMKEKAYLNHAEEFVRTARSRNPDSARVLLAAGTVDAANGQQLSALKEYQRVQELEPRNIDALLGLADTYDALGEPDQALAAYRKAEELDPEYYNSYYALGGFYLRGGHYPEAVEEFEKMVVRAPQLSDSYSSLAAPLVQLERYAEAEDALRKSLNLRETAQALNNLGVIRYLQGRYEEAARLQKRALTYEPRRLTWMLNEADNLRWAGHRSDAWPYYKRAREQAKLDITVNPQWAWPRAYFAYACARLGERTRAEEEIVQAVNLAPTDSLVLDYSVEIHELLGEREAAIEAFRKLTPAVQQELTHLPDLADFYQDSRIKQVKAQKGGP